MDISYIKDEAKIATEINSAWTDYRNTFKTKFDNFVGYLKDFLSYRDDASGDKTKCKSFLPKTHEQVVIIQTRLMDAISGSRPYGRAVGRQSPLNEVKVTYLQDYQLEQADFYLTTDQVLLDTGIFGTGIYKLPWHQEWQRVPLMEMIYAKIPGTDQPLIDEQTGEPVVLGDRIARDKDGKIKLENTLVYEGPDINHIPIFDFFKDPEGIRPDFKDSVYVGHRFWNTMAQLESEKRPNGEPLYKNLDKLREWKGSRSKKDEAEKGGSSEPGLDIYRRELNNLYGINSATLPYNLYECIEYVTDDKICVAPVGADFLIRNDDNPYLSKFYRACRFYEMPGQFYGIGVVQPTKKMQHTINTLVDNAIDAINIDINKHMVVNEDITDDRELLVRQDAVTHVKGSGNVRDALMWIQTHTPIQDLFRMIDLFDRSMQTTSGVTDMEKGTPPPGMETATETNVLAQKGSVRIKYLLQKLEKTYAKPVLEGFLKLNQLFMTREQAIRIMGDDGIMQDLTVTPAEMQGQYDYKFEWSERETNKNVDRQQLQGLLNIVSGIQPGMMSPISAWVIKQLVPLFPGRDIDGAQQALQQTLQIPPQLPPGGAGGQGAPSSSAGAPVPPQEMPVVMGEQDVAQQMANVLKPSIGAMA